MTAVFCPDCLRLLPGQAFLDDGICIACARRHRTQAAAEFTIAQLQQEFLARGRQQRANERARRQAAQPTRSG